MDDKAMQRWGVLIGGGAIVAALGIASLSGPRETETQPAAKVAVAAAPPVLTASKAPVAAPPVADPAQANLAKANPVFEAAEASLVQNVSFIVRFDGSHPLALAQNLEQQGRHSDAVRSARAAIQRRADLRGLCFDRFTLGGAEIVLRACNSVPAAERPSFQRRWTQRLSAMNGVAYAEPNHTLQPEARR